MDKVSLAYSITDGLAIGIISFVILDLIIYVIDFIKYKEEWKGLSKKEDIIAYLVKKTEEEEN